MLTETHDAKIYYRVIHILTKAVKRCIIWGRGVVRKPVKQPRAKPEAKKRRSQMRDRLSCFTPDEDPVDLKSDFLRALARRNSFFKSAGSSSGVKQVNRSRIMTSVLSPRASPSAFVLVFLQLLYPILYTFLLTKSMCG